MNKLRDIHFKIDEETFNKLKKICIYKGDMTYHLQHAVKAYLWKVSWDKSRIPETKKVGGRRKWLNKSYV
jgi:hypothetical protein